jgi:hypothetical protein
MIHSRQPVTFHQTSEQQMVEHAVIVHFEYTADNLHPLRELERELEAAIASAKVGEFDGDEVSVDLSHGSLWMYGPDADAIFDVIHVPLASAPAFRKVRVIRRYGPPKDGIQSRTDVIKD